MEARHTEDIVAIVFLDIALIVVVARLLSLLFRRFRQPSVVAEIIAALMLGPSLLGTLPGNPTDILFPPDVRPFLSIIAALGLIIFMFIVGLELDLSLIRGKGRAAATISVCSVILPFALGALLALWLYRDHGIVDGDKVPRLAFALFIGAAMSVTAFPVLARILTERGIHRTATGALALACAAVDDILAWTMLAVVLAVVRSSGPADFITMVLESIAFVGVMFWLVRPRLRVIVRLREAAGYLKPDVFAVVLVGMLLASFVTDRIGIHAIFGAFLFGTIMPREGAAQLSHELLERVEQITVLLLLPVFFVVTGLNVDVTALGALGLAELGAILAVACLGKFLGAALAAKVVGIPTRQAGAIGILMNTRGLTELVVLNIGLAANILDAQLFSVMVVMAIATTVMTEPLLRLVYTDSMVARDIADAERAALGMSAQYRVVSLIEASQGPQAVDVAVALLGVETSSQLVISRFDPPFRAVEVGSGLTSELAAIATSFESLHQLQRRAISDGASVVVHSHISEDPTADIVALTQAVGADVLVLASSFDDPDAQQLVTRAECSVVVVLVPDGETESSTASGVLAGISRFAAFAGSDDDGLAAIEQAWRAAVRRSTTMAIFETGERRVHRRSATLHRKVASTIVDLDEGPATPAPDEPMGNTALVIGWSDWRRAGPDSLVRTVARRCGCVLLVRASLDYPSDRLTRLLASRRATGRT